MRTISLNNNIQVSDSQTGYAPGVNYSITVGNNNTSTTFDGTISGSGGVAKTGTGMLTLTGSNTYTGDTIVDTGTLSVSAFANPGVASQLGAGTNLVFGGGILRYTGETWGHDQLVAYRDKLDAALQAIALNPALGHWPRDTAGAGKTRWQTVMAYHLLI